MDRTGDSRPTFLWRGILILLPLALLAGAGLYSLRQDRLLADVEARQRCQNLAENYASTISSRLLERMQSLASSQLLSEEIMLDQQGNLYSIDSSQQRAKIPPDPAPHPLPLSDLSPPQGEVWHEALRAEFTGADSIPAWRKFIGLAPPRPFLAQARYDLGLRLAGHREVEAADKLFSDVQSDPAAETESGLPLWLLAELQRAELASAKFEDICEDVVNHPTFATPAMLARLAESHPNRKWLDAWEKDQATREFYLHTRAALTNTSTEQTFWTMWDGNEWLVEIFPAKAGATVRPFARDVAARALRDVLANEAGQASYAQLGVDVAGRSIFPLNPQWPILGSATNGTVTVREALSEPGLLYVQQRVRTAWFAVLILVSAMAAMVGFVSAYRGFHQQLRLSEMKSNFVSSVSHELRAPIASMRLLAESLERGKVADPAKQKEYFGFLVQESRRLSSLIENILDFSRIEQGRKKYEFESTNLDVLVAQTIKVMEPCATERGVKLKLQKAEGNGAATVHCDGLAIQQALINLIDNAIKHSPAGEVVVIGLERGPGIFRLWVEDQGPGIPAEDHQRIYELFYRRGSELRRETQGIGIGLTIVKHSVEAHGGRVVLRSAVGEGSRFAIELPDPAPSVGKE